MSNDKPGGALAEAVYGLTAPRYKPWVKPLVGFIIGFIVSFTITYLLFHFL